MARRGRIAFDKTENVYFFTTTLSGFINVLTLKDKYFEILLESLKWVIAEHSAKLIAFVFMPNHIHLVHYMPEGESISDFMRDFKRHTSKEIRKDLQKNRNYMLLNKLTKISEMGKFKLWMDRFDCQVIYSKRVLETKINYIHFNPVKAGLVKEMIDWKYSSARNYYLGDNSLINVAIDFNI